MIFAPLWIQRPAIRELNGIRRFAGESAIDGAWMFLRGKFSGGGGGAGGAKKRRTIEGVLV